MGRADVAQSLRLLWTRSFQQLFWSPCLNLFAASILPCHPMIDCKWKVSSSLKHLNIQSGSSQSCELRVVECFFCVFFLHVYSIREHQLWTTQDCTWTRASTSLAPCSIGSEAAFGSIRSLQMTGLQEDLSQAHSTVKCSKI